MVNLNNFSPEEIKEHNAFVAAERKSHPYKSRFSEVGIGNAFGSIPKSRPGEVYQLLIAGGFDCQYGVSNYGRVVSLTSGRVLKYGMNRPAKDHGYPHVGLMKDGKEVTVKVSSLVSENFCDNRLGKTGVHHIDRNTLNNRADNLLPVTDGKDGEHGELHRILNECDKTGDYSAYWQRVAEIRADNAIV